MVAPSTKIEAGIEIGPGINIGDFPVGYSITLQSSDFAAGYPYNTATVQYPIPLGTNGVDGFTVDFSHIPPDPSDWIYTAYSPYNATINSQSVADFFNDLVTASVLSSATETALWSVTWGAGSSIASGYAVMSGVPVVNDSIYIAPVDTGAAGWNTSPPQNNFTQELAGTFMFPATFTLVTPAINKGGWC
jgi:hypothetical protein